jgi:hypothetical protein
MSHPLPERSAKTPYGKGFSPILYHYTATLLREPKDHLEIFLKTTVCEIDTPCTSSGLGTDHRTMAKRL